MSVFDKQCRYCAFKLTEDQSTEAALKFVEEKYQAIRGIGGAPKKSRAIFVGGADERTETCFINSKTWKTRNKEAHCRDRIDSALSLESAVALREVRASNQIAFDAKVWAIISAIIATIAIAISW